MQYSTNLWELTQFTRNKRNQMATINHPSAKQKLTDSPQLFENQYKEQPKQNHRKQDCQRTTINECHGPHRNSYANQFGMTLF